MAGVTAAAVATSGTIAVGAPAPFSIPGSGEVSARATCPGEKLATGGGYRITSEFTAKIVGLHPSRRGWRTTLFNNFVSVPLEGVATAICGANRDRYEVVTKRVSRTSSALSTDVVLMARCPDGATLAGGGASYVEPGVDASTTIFSSRPARGAWKARFGISAQGLTAEFPLRAYAVCDETGARYATRRDSATPSAARAAARGGAVLPYDAAAACPRRSKVSGGGFAFAQEEAPRKIGKRGRRFVVRGASSAPDPGPVKAFARCLK